MTTQTLPTGAPVSTRLASIDLLRGTVMLLMLLDHVRERFLYHRQVADPMDLDVTDPGLFFTRMLAHLCAPVFVFLTGLSAWLYANPVKGQARDASAFLFKRGLFLILLEATLVNLSWFGRYETLYLQVIWAIGVSMLALAALCRLPRPAVFGLGLLIVFGHNLLTPISFEPGQWGYTAWSILHDRGTIFTSEALTIRASYPVLPWIGVILLGFSAGPLFSAKVDSDTRIRLLVQLGLAALAMLLVLRGLNLYGETVPWQSQASVIETVMDFFNYTKYPPSLDYLLLTLGIGFLLLALFERARGSLALAVSTFGSAPMFFYLLHLYVLLLGYQLAMAFIGPNYGELYAFDNLSQIWLVTVILAVVLYFPTVAFARFKRRTSWGWVKYF
ncbi:DUF1624 domain-containing protein [Ferrimonas marina]|uniref:DUF1624 domain-containing protein n=1 Tax=Ferrimonas marina TaxID=299255 RepID=UPI00082E47AC|nr:heparan-alpha-glucosaminide N-acetyltransferase domain-containing protein [Ferrimonas marina]